MGYTERILKKESKKFSLEKSFKNTILKNGSVIVHGKDKKKTKLNTKKKLFSIEIIFNKIIYQRSYHWGYTGEISKCKTQKKKFIYCKNQYLKTYPNDGIHGYTGKDIKR